MARKGKLGSAAVRKIFKSVETAKALGSRYGVSQNMIYLIRSGRAHQKVTGGLAAPKRTRGRRSAQAPDARIDINKLADALLNRIVARLRGR